MSRRSNGIAAGGRGTLAQQGVDAIMVIGTSLTFLSRADEAASRYCSKDLRERTGLPVKHHEPGADRRLARDRAPSASPSRPPIPTSVNRSSRSFWRRPASRFWSLECFDPRSNSTRRKKAYRSRDHLRSSDQPCASPRRMPLKAARRRGHSDLLRRLADPRCVAEPLEANHGIPVVSSATAAFWAAMRLVGESGHVDGYGRLFEQSREPAN